MPGFDGTGPRGMGQGKNKGLGRCMAGRGRKGLGAAPRMAGSVDDRIAALERELAELKALRDGAA